MGKVVSPWSSQRKIQPWSALLEAEIRVLDPCPRLWERWHSLNNFLMAQSYVSFKKVVYRREIYTFSETVPSGTYWIYLLDSIICDLRMELISISLGDPKSGRIVGGDDSYSMLQLEQFTLKLAQGPLAAIGIELSEPPKTQVRLVSDRTAPPLKFHGHKSMFSPFREDIDILCSAHRTSETILCLWVTAPTGCVWHDRWFHIFFFHPYLGKISNLTNIFQMGWNHQPVNGWFWWLKYTLSIQTPSSPGLMVPSSHPNRS